MKALYFNNKKSSLIFRKFIGLSSSTLSTLAPTLFAKFCFNIFMNPHGRRSYKFLNHSPEEISVNAHHGIIRTYYFKGGDKNILLTHGWADNSKSFETLIAKLLDEGFSVWCFDHAGHGFSDGNVANLFAFIDGLKKVIKHIEAKGVILENLISHSMGGAAIINLDEDFLKNKKIVLLAPPVKLFEEMFNSFNRIGISKNVLTNLLEYISKHYKSDWTKLKPMDQKHKIHKNFFIVHDKKDKQCKYENMINLMAGTQGKIFTTEGLGHRGILKDIEVSKVVVQFLRNE